jgi:putative acetyltransferase
LTWLISRPGEHAMAIRLVQPHSDREWRRARQLIEEYAASLDLDLSFQNIAHELEHLPGEYGPPAGAFFLPRRMGRIWAAWAYAVSPKASARSSVCI